MNNSKRNNDLNRILTSDYGANRENLIPILQEIQNKEEYLSKERMVQVSKYLKIPVSKVYGVASFYNQFRFQPKGKYLIQVCRGTACHVQGSEKILDTLKARLKIESGETTPDGLFTLEVVACIGACGLAPVITINGEYYAQLTPEKLNNVLNKYLDKSNEVKINEK